MYHILSIAFSFLLVLSGFVGVGQPTIQPMKVELERTKLPQKPHEYYFYRLAVHTPKNLVSEEEKKQWNDYFYISGLKRVNSYPRSLFVDVDVSNFVILKYEITPTTMQAKQPSGQMADKEFYQYHITYSFYLTHRLEDSTGKVIEQSPPPTQKQHTLSSTYFATALEANQDWESKDLKAYKSKIIQGNILNYLINLSSELSKSYGYVPYKVSDYLWGVTDLTNKEQQKANELYTARLKEIIQHRAELKQPFAANKEVKETMRYFEQLTRLPSQNLDQQLLKASGLNNLALLYYYFEDAPTAKLYAEKLSRTPNYENQGVKRLGEIEAMLKYFKTTGTSSYLLQRQFPLIPANDIIPTQEDGHNHHHY